MLFKERRWAVRRRRAVNMLVRRILLRSARRSLRRRMFWLMLDMCPVGTRSSARRGARLGLTVSTSSYLTRTPLHLTLSATSASRLDPTSHTWDNAHARPVRSLRTHEIPRNAMLLTLCYHFDALFPFKTQLCYNTPPPLLSSDKDSVTVPVVFRLGSFAVCLYVVLFSATRGSI